MDIKNITSFIIRTDTLGAYINAISKIKPITAQEERDLFARYEQLSENERLCKDILSSFKDGKDLDYYKDELAKTQREMVDVRNEIISRNLRFNFAVAKRYSTDDNLPDLINEGMIGMQEAFESYDWRTGNRFCSFAVWHIRRAINAYFTTKSPIIRHKGNRIIPKVKRIENDFYLKNGRKPSTVEIMDILEKDFGIKVDSESEMYDSCIDRIESYIGDDEDLTMENSPAFTERTSVNNGYEDEIEMSSTRHALDEALKSLTDRERTVVCMAYGYDGYLREYKDKEIGQALGLSSERIRQIRHAAIKKMRSAYVAAVEE